MTAVRLSVVLACAAAMLSFAPSALAAPPPNDARAGAQSVQLPASVRGTTVEATLEASELGSACNTTKNSVWYAFTADTGRSMIVALDAEGDLDATIDVYARERSQVNQVACKNTNRRGAATIEIDAKRGTSYYVRVGARTNSADDRFLLRVVTPDQPASFPGRRLPRKGAHATVDRFANPDDAWAVHLQRGTTYRLNFVSSGGRCATAELFAHEDDSPVRRLRCDAHTVVAPSASGTYSVLVRAPRGSRDRLTYRVRVGRAGADDTAPGIRLANDVRNRGHLQGNQLDAIDLYRFTIARPSELRLTLGTGKDFDLRLMTDTGHQIACECGSSGSKEIDRRVRPGRYFAVVRANDGAAGKYALRRLARAITHARMLVDGGRSARVGPGQGVTLDLAVSPPVAGHAALLIERFDPLVGWLFHSSPRPAVIGGHGRMHFTPPSVGRWRIAGDYVGTRTAAPSSGGTVRVTVEEPLED